MPSWFKNSSLKPLLLSCQSFNIFLQGEVAVNRYVDTRLYSTLHALVNGMFPSMSLSDQV